MITYRVALTGEGIKDETTVFTSLKKAKEYMKKIHPFAVDMGASLLTLCSVEIWEDGYEDATGINTRTTITNL